jgi:DNA repair exonuclease SbcCD nuclease subunit
VKVVLLGDTHFGARNDNIHFHTYFRKFYEDIFFPYLDANEITHVIQLGDVFDRRKYVNFATLSHCRDYFFDPLAKRNISTYLLVGNHDTYYKNTNDVNSPSLLLSEYENLHIVNDPTEVVFGGVKFLLVPWICSDNEKEIVGTIARTDTSVLCGHFEIQGFEMHKGAVCEDGIDPKTFSSIETVVSGHFHHKSKIKNIQYIGTPYEMTWSDFGDDKVFAVYDTDTRDISLIPNPQQIFFKMHYDDIDKQMDEVLVDDFAKYQNSIVKVIVRNKTNPLWFDMFIDKLEKSGVIDIQVVEDHFHLDLEDDTDIVNEAEDTLTILGKYIDQLEVKGDRQRLDNLVRTLYYDALNLE